ncbi:MAG: hypothetical protein AAGE94_07155 [Acidobacteriota bacterium]
MPSTTVADYQVLQPRKFVLENGGHDSEPLSFTLPSDFAHRNGARRPILAFKIRVFEDDTTFTAQIGGNDIFTVENLDTSHIRAHWKPFDAEDAFPNGTASGSTQTLTIHMNSGKARFSDVVLWYQIRRDP